MSGEETEMPQALEMLLLAALESPEDRAPCLILADWLEEHGHPKARRIRKDCTAGSAYFRSASPSGASDGGRLGVVHLLVPLLPQHVAVEFGCRCASHVLPSFEREFPGDERPRRLAVAVRRWLRGEVTKREVFRVRETTVAAAQEEVAMQNWDQGWTPEQTAARLQAVWAAQSIVQIAFALSYAAKSGQWEGHVCRALVEAADAVEGRLAEQEWQRRELITLLREAI